MSQIGITERGDAALNLDWKFWVDTLMNPAILISKDPLKLYSELQKDYNVIVHCSITGLPKVIESNVPETENQVEGFYKIRELLGKDRVVLRVDPIIVEGVECAYSVIDYFKDEDIRLRISFMDYYSHVKQRFEEKGLTLNQDFHANLKDRLKIVERIKRSFPKVQICGEPNIECEGCISEFDCFILGVEPILSLTSQRPSCKCLANKRELLTLDKCKHGCLYCYWKD